MMASEARSICITLGSTYLRVLRVIANSRKKNKKNSSAHLPQLRIGQGIAKRFAEEGAKIVIEYRGSRLPPKPRSEAREAKRQKHSHEWGSRPSV